jgi:hypothetical protein
MSGNRKTPLWPWIVAVLIGLPVLYVLSSGPTRTVAFHRFSDGTSSTGVRVTSYMADEWWLSLYGPMIWVTQQAWGAPLNWYWERFPLDDMPKHP